MFSLTHKPIVIDGGKRSVVHPAAGAYVSFEGWVRNKNEGKEVLYLEYEAYPALACQEGLKIIMEAKQKFSVQSIRCVHRTGKLEIGEIAIWIGVSSEHREPAFKACEYVINEIKRRVPVWKKEYYTNGDSGWVNCEQCAHHLHQVL